MQGGEDCEGGAGEGWELGDAGMQMLEACGEGKLEQVQMSPSVQHSSHKRREHHTLFVRGVEAMNDLFLASCPESRTCRDIC